jgi:ABC-type sugar transport system ATPase subunit
MIGKKREPDNVKEAVFQVRDLAKIYKMGEVEVHALRGVDMELYSGELVVFLGPSGSGKSTLLNILGGLDTATRGFVSYRGRDLTKANEQELTEYRRFHVGFVFQFYNLISSLTARENVAVVTEIAGNPMVPEDALALVWIIFPPSSPAASSNAWRSPAPYPKIRRSCSATNLRGLSIPKQALWCSKPWNRSIASWVRQRRSSPTTWTLPAWPTGSFI